MSLKIALAAILGATGHHVLTKTYWRVMPQYTVLKQRGDHFWIRSNWWPSHENPIPILNRKEAGGVAHAVTQQKENTFDDDGFEEDC